MTIHQFKKGDLIYYREGCLSILLECRSSIQGNAPFFYSVEELASINYLGFLDFREYRPNYGEWNLIPLSDIVLYTNWPKHSKRFWDLLGSI
jgi:hypothetical protein